MNRTDDTSAAILVLGGGGLVGQETVRLLARRGRVGPLIVADRNLDAARRVASEVGGEAIEIDVADADATRALVRRARVVLNATAPFTRHGVPVLRAAIEAGAHYADVNDELASIREIFAAEDLQDMARRAGISAIVCLGTSPGLTNIVAAHAVRQLEQVSSIHMALCTGPWNRSEAVWAHRLRVNSEPATIFRDGAWLDVPAMSEEEVVTFPWPPHEAVVRIVAHPEPLTLARSVPGVREVVTKVGYPAFMNRLIHDLVSYGLSSEEPLSVGQARVTPAEVIASYLASEAADRVFGFSALQPYSVRQIRVTGTLGGRAVTLTYQLAFRGGPLETALPLAVAGELLAAGRVTARGILAPESVDPAPFLAELRALGVKMRVVRDELGDIPP
jgi:saccharopine dehydrogenase (NAD+, L-lysine-forming)